MLLIFVMPRLIRTMNRFLFVFAAVFILPFGVSAQGFESLSFDEADEEITESSAFNAPVIISTQSTDITGQGELYFHIAHRFGTFNQGAFNLFGLDYGAIRLGFEYGLWNNLRLGVGRSSIGKNYDASVKYRPFTQTSGARTVPITAVLFSSASLSSTDLKNRRKISDEANVADHLVYTFQLLLSRKFSERLSLQATSTLLHYNTALFPNTNNDLLAMGLAGRFFLGGKIHLTADYHYVFNDNTLRHNPLALGIDIVVGGHTFQLHAGNAVGMIEKEFIGATFADVADGDIRLGFSVFRTFNVKPKVAGGKIY